MSLKTNLAVLYRDKVVSYTYIAYVTLRLNANVIAPEGRFVAYPFHSELASNVTRHSILDKRTK